MSAALIEGWHSKREGRGRTGKGEQRGWSLTSHGVEPLPRNRSSGDVWRARGYGGGGERVGGREAADSGGDTEPPQTETWKKAKRRKKTKKTKRRKKTNKTKTKTKRRRRETRRSRKRK